MPSVGVEKGTIVRLKLRVIRAGFLVAEVIAPTQAARVATRLWFTIPPPPRVPRPPQGGEVFEVPAQHSTVRGVSYGTGPVVYLVHGWGGLGAQLGGLVEPLRSSGFRVVLFDAPGHGKSDPGPSGPGRSHGLEFSQALNAVADRFGPAHTVIAHSMGAMVTLLSQAHGGLSTQQLVFLSPMRDLATHLDRFANHLGIGPRVRGQITVRTEDLVDYPIVGFDIRVLSGLVMPVPLLVIHDRRDRETFHADSVEIVSGRPGYARMVSTDGLGHRRGLNDDHVIGEVVRFIQTGNEKNGQLPDRHPRNNATTPR